jgi:hypothetical protein
LKPPNERRRKVDKGSGRIGKNTGLGRFREKLPRPAILKTIPLDCEIKCSLRVKRRDPWLWANASSKAMADPKPVVKTRRLNSQACLDLVCRPVAQPPAEAS